MPFEIIASVTCPICGNKTIYDLRTGRPVVFVSSFEYETDEDGDEIKHWQTVPIPESMWVKDAHVGCGYCKITWHTEDFCRDWNNYFRFDESDEDGGWGIEAAWSLFSPKSVDHLISVLRYGLRLPFGKETEEAIKKKCQTYIQSRDDADEQLRKVQGE